jgi:hypothetical protein
MFRNRTNTITKHYKPLKPKKMRATNLTTKTIKTLDLIYLEGLDLTKFYCITLHIEKIVIMGKFSSELLRECKKILGQEFISKVIKPFELSTENDWICGEYEIGGNEEEEIEGVRIDITLT